jgi:ABC-2 type transport system permease protein/lipopolysaccharide transport system permease protein
VSSASVPVPGLPDVGNAPPPELLYRHRLRIAESLRDLWRHREVALSLTERGLRARYKQTMFGVAWALITPLTLMVVFTIFFKRVADVDTGDVPYSVYAYVGLLPWTLFSGAVNGSATTILTNTSLLNKVYCPREVFPVSSVAMAVVDAACATTALVVLFLVTGFVPSTSSYWAVPLVALLLLYAMGVSLIVSAVTVYLRDIRYGLPILLQLGLFATPIAYSFDKIPTAWQPLYSAVNPLAPIIDGLRRAVLFGTAPELDLVAIAGVSTFVVLGLGYALFKRLEPGFADVA